VVEQRLRDAGFPPDGTIIDQEWGRFSPTHPTAPLSRSTSKTPSSIHEKDGGHESTREEDMMATVSVRYIVDDVDAAIVFYTQHLGFDEVMHPAPTFAMLSRGDLRLNLSAPSGQGGGGQAMPDGTRPEPGGWNRFSLEVPDLDATVEQLHAAGVHFRNDIVTGVGGKQILLDDPSGNPVELFQPTRSEAALNTDS
jgi:catechol 2,3-dioxygenase-like lactoylglutathione lyase family enzyme